MPRFRILLLASLMLLSACNRTAPPSEVIHRWDQATWNNSFWH